MYWWTVVVLCVASAFGSVAFRDHSFSHYFANDASLGLEVGQCCGSLADQTSPDLRKMALMWGYVGRQLDQ